MLIPDRATAWGVATPYLHGRASLATLRLAAWPGYLVPRALSAAEIPVNARKIDETILDGRVDYLLRNRLTFRW